MSELKQPPENACVGIRRDIGARTLCVALLLCGLSGAGHTQVERYKYRLEEGTDNDLCSHMTQVFNTKFKTPWDKGQKPWESSPTIFGKPYEQVFERLPGVAYNVDFVWDMLLSKYPLSPEFDAVNWKEGRATFLDGATPPNNVLAPMLVAEIDIDNDGQKEWVIKYLFMDKMTTDEGWGQSYGGEDVLSVFPSDGFDAQNTPTDKQLHFGQMPDRPPLKVDRHIDSKFDTMQIRPFLYQGKTYLSAYQTVWKERDHSNEARPRYRHYPDYEYMNILRFTGRGLHLNRPVIEMAITETICRIRMIMLNNTTASKGN